MTTKSRTLLIIVIAGILGVVWVAFALNCPSEGIALTSRARALHHLKNRTSFPKDSDFESRISLDELLKQGDDSNRWSTQRAGRVEGYVIDVSYARPEATNCFNPCRRDIHILVAQRKDAAKNEQVVIEVTPHFHDWAAQQGLDWSEEALQAELVGHWCEFEGWLYFDVGHTDQSENTASHNTTNWRATAWELHPVTKITVIQ